MKILIASTPATGHFNPLLAIVRMLRAEGHEISFLTGSAFRARIENTGAKFVSLPTGAHFDLRDLLSVAPELKDIPPGFEWFRIVIERIFVDAVPAQHQGLLQALQECQADVIVGDDMFLGVLPMLLGSRSKRPPIVLGATVFAYVTGSSLFFVDVVGLRPDQYGLIFSACSAAVMSGALFDGCLGRRGISAAWVLTIGLTVSAAASATLLAMTVAGWTQPAVIAALLMAVALAFGMTMPNVMNATMQPLPEIAGVAGAAAGSIQMTAGAASSGLVAILFDGRSAFSMAAVMATCSLLALIAYCLLARPAERRIYSQAVEAPAAIEGAMHL